MKLQRILTLCIASGLILSVFASCGNKATISDLNSSSGQQTASALTSDTDSLNTDSLSSSDFTNSAYSGSGTTNSKKPTSSKTPAHNPSNGSKTIYVKDFGAKGDGVTDDAEAIMLALGNLQEIGDGGVLVFESNKTYYARNNGTTIKTIFSVNSGKNLTVKGNNTTILIGSGRAIAGISNTANFTMTGFNFDYKIKPGFRATAVSGGIDNTQHTAVMIADRDFNFDEFDSNGFYQAPHSSEWSGAVDRPDGRYPMFISKYQLLDKKTRKIKIYFHDYPGSYTFERLKTLLPKYDLTAPMPGMGHTIQQAFDIRNNTNFTMSNCNVYSYSKFGFGVFNNQGTVKFTNVDLVRAPNALDQKLNLVGWRDGFHCKENRAKIIWDNCKAECLYDDVFNISASTMYVKEVNSAKDEINMYWPETNSVYSALKPGDALTIINTQTGEMIGRTTVKRVVSQQGITNKIKLTDSLPKLTNGEKIHVFFDSMAAPHSEIKNSSFSGTFRMRGSVTVTNSSFKVVRFFIDLDKMMEGPLGRNMLFKNSKFTFDGPKNRDFIIDSYNPNPSVSNAYHAENIVFDSCQISKNNMSIGINEDVKLVNCR